MGNTFSYSPIPLSPSLPVSTLGCVATAGSRWGTPSSQFFIVLQAERDEVPRGIIISTQASDDTTHTEHESYYVYLVEHYLRPLTGEFGVPC